MSARASSRVMSDAPGEADRLAPASFWAMRGRATGRAHWFPDVGRMSGCGNHFSHDDTHQVADTEGLRVCFVCERRAIEVRVLGSAVRSGRIRG